MGQPAWDLTRQRLEDLLRIGAPELDAAQRSRAVSSSASASGVAPRSGTPVTSIVVNGVDSMRLRWWNLSQRRPEGLPTEGQRTNG
jgi:hypothetical protein